MSKTFTATEIAYKWISTGGYEETGRRQVTGTAAGRFLTVNGFTKHVFDRAGKQTAKSRSGLDYKHELVDITWEELRHGKQAAK